MEQDTRKQEEKKHIIQEPTRFSDSKIWEFQNQYFSERGIDAWRNGEVPHYITSNPQMAVTYAELIFAFFRDLSRNRLPVEPVYILELGAGSGRFSYHLLKTLTNMCAKAAFEIPEFIYVISDYIEENVAFCEGHPRLAPFVRDGKLDFAVFNMVEDQEITLRNKKFTIKQNSLRQPLVLIANYVFDSIPQDLLFSDGKNLYHSYASLSSKTDLAGIHAADKLKSIEIDYQYKLFDETGYDTAMKKITSEYLEKCPNSHILFPRPGVNALINLCRLSQKGHMLLTSDKGNHRIEEFAGMPAPYPVKHGSFSFSVNYHAFKRYTELSGGAAIFSKNIHHSINTGCLIWLKNAEKYSETFNCFNAWINNFGPDDFFSIKKHAERTIDLMQIREILAYIRLSGYDSRLFSQVIQKLFERSLECTEEEKLSLLHTCAKVWDMYFPLGEDLDLAFLIGKLLVQITCYNEALNFFDLSLDIKGETCDTLFGKALCYYGNGENEKCLELLKEVLEIEPDFIPALEVQEELTS